MMRPVEELKVVGSVCQMSHAGTNKYRYYRYKFRKGEIVGIARNGDYRIKWEGNTTPRNFDPKYIEILEAELSVPAPLMPPA